MRTKIKYEIHPTFRESKRPRYYSDKCREMSLQRAVIFLNHNGEKTLRYDRAKPEIVVKLFFAKIGLTPPDPTTTNVVHRLMDLYLMDLWPFFAYDYGFLQSDEWKAAREKCFAKHGRICARCGSTKNLHIDHIKPRSHVPGARLRQDNLQVLCAWCNMSKGNRNNLDYTPRGETRLGVYAICNFYREFYKKHKKTLPELGQQGTLRADGRPYLGRSLVKLRASKIKKTEIMPWFFTEQHGHIPVVLIARRQYELYESLYLGTEK